MKIVINVFFGGFGLSDEAIKRISELKGTALKHSFEAKDDRTDPVLIKVIEELGEKADGCFAKLKIIDIPDDIEYEICEYDGYEHIAEKHRTWG